MLNQHKKNYKYLIKLNTIQRKIIYLRLHKSMLFTMEFKNMILSTHITTI